MMNTPYLGTPGTGENYSGSAATTVLSDLSTPLASNSLSVGGGTALVVMSTITVPLVATTAVANKSTTTTFAFSGAKAPATANGTGSDTYIVAANSGISAGVIIDAYSSATDVITLRLSNVSGLAASQDAITLRVTRFGF